MTRLLLGGLRWRSIARVGGLALSLQLGLAFGQGAPDPMPGARLPDDGRPADPPPEDGPPPDQGDARSDLILIKIAFDDRAGQQLKKGYALLKPDNDPAQKKCAFEDNGRGDDEAEGDFVYYCEANTQRSQLLSMTVFTVRDGKDVLLVESQLKLPSAPSATVAIRAPADYDVGEFKVLDPFYFMEPDPGGDGPDADAKAPDGIKEVLTDPSGPGASKTSVTSQAPVSGGGGRADKLLWAVVAALAAMQLLRLGLLSKAAAANERLRQALLTHERPLLAEALPDVRGAAAALELPFRGEGGAAPQAAATQTAEGPRAADRLWDVMAMGSQLLLKGGPSGLAATLPAGAHPHDPERLMAQLHQTEKVPVALWQTFTLSPGAPTAVLLGDGANSEGVLASLCRELAGRYALPCVVMTTQARALSLDTLLLTAAHRARPYPPAPWRPGSEALESVSGPPEVAERLVLSTGAELSRLRPFLRAATQRHGRVVVVVDDPVASGLTDTLITPEAAARELLGQLAELSEDIRPLVLLLMAGPLGEAAAASLSAQGAAAVPALRLERREERRALVAWDTSPGGKQLALELQEELGWMWPQQPVHSQGLDAAAVALALKDERK